MAEILSISAAKGKFDSGPGHADGLICPDNSLCRKCQGRILQIYVKFFQDKIGEEVQKTCDKDQLCLEGDCPICVRAKAESIICPGGLCAKPTGKERSGVLAIEVLQYHHEKEHVEGKDPLKKCGCTIHIRPHILCSAACHASSMFSPAPLPPDAKFDEGIYISPAGPLRVVQQYLLDIKKTTDLPESVQKEIEASGPAAAAPSAPASESSTASTGGSGKGASKIGDVRDFVLPAELRGVPRPADTCFCCTQSGATKICGRCKSARYCSKECQVEHWPLHKIGCTAPASK